MTPVETFALALLGWLVLSTTSGWLYAFYRVQDPRVALAGLAVLLATLLIYWVWQPFPTPFLAGLTFLIILGFAAQEILRRFRPRAKTEPPPSHR